MNKTYKLYLTKVSGKVNQALIWQEKLTRQNFKCCSLQLQFPGLCCCEDCSSCTGVDGWSGHFSSILWLLPYSTHSLNLKKMELTIQIYFLSVVLFLKRSSIETIWFWLMNDARSPAQPLLDTRFPLLLWWIRWALGTCLESSLGKDLLALVVLVEVLVWELDLLEGRTANVQMGGNRGECEEQVQLAICPPHAGGGGVTWLTHPGPFLFSCCWVLRVLCIFWITVHIRISFAKILPVTVGPSHFLWQRCAS
jgi:hypothetical protein